VCRQSGGIRVPDIYHFSEHSRAFRPTAAVGMKLAGGIVLRVLATMTFREMPGTVYRQVRIGDPCIRAAASLFAATSATASLTILTKNHHRP
jgi:hypothetical protein